MKHKSLFKEKGKKKCPTIDMSKRSEIIIDKLSSEEMDEDTLYDWYTKETQKRLDYFDESEEFDFMVDDMVGSIYENISRSFWKAVKEKMTYN